MTLLHSYTWNANATVSRITIVCHLFCTMSILLCFELDTNPGRKGGGEGGGGGGTFDMVISMKPLRILLVELNLCNQC